MTSKIMNVYYGIDYLPYKDIGRQVHYPIMNGTLITGENNTRTIRFYVGLIGGVGRTWIANVKKPDGTLFYQLCTNPTPDSGEYYVELDISNLFADQIGAVYIGLQGYDDDVTITDTNNDNVYEISGNPSIIATGTIKILVNYSPSVLPKGETLSPSTEQLILASLGTKLEKTLGIIAVDTLPSSTVGYDNNQMLFTKDNGIFWKVVSGIFIKLDFSIPYANFDVASVPTFITNRLYYGKIQNDSGLPADLVGKDILYSFYTSTNGFAIHSGNVYYKINGTWNKDVKQTLTGKAYADEFYDGNDTTNSNRKLTNKGYVDGQISGAKTYADGIVNDLEIELRALIGVANGLATLDSNGKVPMTQINSQVARTSESGNSVLIWMDNGTFNFHIQLLDKNGSVISSDSVDLPLEEIVVSGAYDSVNKKIVLTLKSGQTIQIPIGDLINGLLATTDIVDNLTTNDATKVLSAKQGKILKDQLDTKAPQSTTYTKTEVDNIKGDLIEDMEEIVAVVPTDIVGNTTNNSISLYHDGVKLTGQDDCFFKTINGRSILGTGNLDGVVIATDYLPSTTKYGARIILSLNTSNYVLTAQLVDQDGNNLGVSSSVDLPVESVVVSGSYDSATKEVILSLQNGNTIRFSVADLISGLVKTSDIIDNLNDTSTNKPLSARQGKLLKDLIDTKANTTDVDTKEEVNNKIQSAISNFFMVDQDNNKNFTWQIKIQNGKAHFVATEVE